MFARFLTPDITELTLFLSPKSAIYYPTHVTISFLEQYLVATNSKSLASAVIYKY